MSLARLTVAGFGGLFAVTAVLYTVAQWPVIGVAVLLSAVMLGIGMGWHRYGAVLRRRRERQEQQESLIQRAARDSLTDEHLASVLNRWSRGKR